MSRAQGWYALGLLAAIASNTAGGGTEELVWKVAAVIAITTGILVYFWERGAP